MPIEDDLRESLARAASSVPPPAGMWERMPDRPSQPPTSPRSRIGAAILAAAVALGGFLLVVRAFGSTDLDDSRNPIPGLTALEGTVWILTEIDGEQVTTERPITLRFAGGEFGAESECNVYGGRYEIDGARLITAGGSTTNVACQGAEATRERLLFEVVRSSPALESSGATLTLIDEAGTLGFVTDPCSLLTDAEVEEATGDAIVSSGLVPPFGMRILDGPKVCSYEVPGRYASVGVSVVPSTLDEFHAVRDRNPESNITIPVTGIGDEAFIQGMASIYVFQGDHYFGIGLQHGAGTPGVERVLKDLARAAVGEPTDPASDVDPVPADVLVVWVERTGDSSAPISVRASYGDRSVPLDAIETPGSELSYPDQDLGVEVPLGTPIVIRSEADSVRVRQLVDAGPGQIVERSARHLPGELQVLDEPGEVAIAVFYEYREGVGELGFTVQVSDQPVLASRLANVVPGWTELATPPEVRSWNSAKVWTGSEVLVWGGFVYTGFSDEVARNDGFAWEPISGATRQLPEAPLAPRSNPAFAWTGQELLVWGGSVEKWGSKPFADGAVYSPGQDAWRVLSPAPIDPRVPLFHVWTGRELIVWGDMRDEGLVDGAAYDLDSDTWRVIASAPPGRWEQGVWTGSEVVVFSNSRSREVARVAAYDPESDAWRSPAPIPLGSVATSAWDGGGVVAWSYGQRLARYEPAADVWTILPKAPLDVTNYWPDAVGGPGFVFGAQGGEAVVLDVTGERWHVVTQKEILLWDTHQIVEAGGVVITLRRNNETGEERAFAYRPPF